MKNKSFIIIAREYFFGLNIKIVKKENKKCLIVIIITEKWN